MLYREYLVGEVIFYCTLHNRSNKTNEGVAIHPQIIIRPEYYLPVFCSWCQIQLAIVATRGIDVWHILINAVLSIIDNKADSLLRINIRLSAIDE